MIHKYSSTSTPALQRGCELISAISQHRGISCTKLGELLEIPKASLNRMIKCLLDNGFICQDSRKGLHIGHELTYQVFRAYENTPLTMNTQKILDRMAQKWDATFVIYEYKEPFQLIWQVKRESLNGIKTQQPGLVTDKMNINAQGQLFLSQMPDEKIGEFFAKGLAGENTPYTIVTKEKMLERANIIRAQGYAIQERENHPAMKQIAVPLKLRNIKGTFALGCFLPLTFPNTGQLKDDMLFESGLIINQE